MVERTLIRERLPSVGGRQLWRGPGVVLTVVVATWWLVVGAVVVAMLPAPAESASTLSFAVTPGRTARINQPGIPVWVIPVERAAYEEYQRGFQESDELIEHAFTVFAWIEVSHHDVVRVVAVDGEAVQVELLEGRSGGRRGWLRTRHLDLPS